MLDERSIAKAIFLDLREHGYLLAAAHLQRRWRDLVESLTEDSETVDLFAGGGVALDVTRRE